MCLDICVGVIDGDRSEGSITVETGLGTVRNCWKTYMGVSSLARNSQMRLWKRLVCPTIYWSLGCLFLRALVQSKMQTALMRIWTWVAKFISYENNSIVCLCVYISWLTVVKDNLKAPFSIATTPRCKRGHYFFPWIAPLTLDPHYIMLSVKQGGIKYYFMSL